MTPTPLAALDAAIVEGRADAPAGTELLAIGWSTVDTERAARGFGAEPPFGDLLRDVTLGATCLLLDVGAALPLVLVEPATEGPLSGSLARLGEGPAVRWYRAGRGAHSPASASAASPASAASTASAATAGAEGPFGPEIPLRSRSTATRFAFLVLAEAATISGMTDHVTDRGAATLRVALPTDADAIASLFTDEGYPAGPTDIVERLERFASPLSRVIVAEHDSALIGFIAIHAMPRFEHDDHILRILALVVDAGARERGVGRALMAEAERIGTELGAAFVEITAGHHRPEARHLYESLGYDASVAAYLRKKL